MLFAVIAFFAIVTKIRQLYTLVDAAEEVFQAGDKGNILLKLEYEVEDPSLNLQRQRRLGDDNDQQPRSDKIIGTGSTFNKIHVNESSNTAEVDRRDLSSENREFLLKKSFLEKKHALESLSRLKVKEGKEKELEPKKQEVPSGNRHREMSEDISELRGQLGKEGDLELVSQGSIYMVPKTTSQKSIYVTGPPNDVVFTLDDSSALPSKLWKELPSEEKEDSNIKTSTSRNDKKEKKKSKYTLKSKNVQKLADYKKLSVHYDSDSQDASSKKKLRNNELQKSNRKEVLRNFTMAGKLVVALLNKNDFPPSDRNLMPAPNTKYKHGNTDSNTDNVNMDSKIFATEITKGGKKVQDYYSTSVESHEVKVIGEKSDILGKKNHNNDHIIQRQSKKYKPKVKSHTEVNKTKIKASSKKAESSRHIKKIGSSDKQIRQDSRSELDSQDSESNDTDESYSDLSIPSREESLRENLSLKQTENQKEDIDRHKKTQKLRPITLKQRQKYNQNIYGREGVEQAMQPISLEQRNFTENIVRDKKAENVKPISLKERLASQPVSKKDYDLIISKMSQSKLLNRLTDLLTQRLTERIEERERLKEQEDHKAIRRNEEKKEGAETWQTEQGEALDVLEKHDGLREEITDEEDQDKSVNRQKESVKKHKGVQNRMTGQEYDERSKETLFQNEKEAIKETSGEQDHFQHSLEEHEELKQKPKERSQGRLKGDFVEERYESREGIPKILKEHNDSVMRRDVVDEAETDGTVEKIVIHVK